MFQRNAIKVLKRVRQECCDNLDDGIGDRQENKRVIAAIGVAIKALARPDFDNGAGVSDCENDRITDGVEL